MVVALVVGLLLGQPEAPATRAIRWDAPLDVCPSAERVEAAVLDNSPESARNVEATASVREDSGGFTLALTITVDGVENTQTFSDADCSTLADATVLSVAIARDPTAELQPGVIEWDEPEPEPEPKPEPAPEPESEPEPEPQPVLETKPEPRTRVSCLAAEVRAWQRGPSVPCLSIGGSAGVALRSVPELGFIGGGAFSVLWPRVGVRVRADATTRQRIRRDSVAVDVRALTFGADVMLRARVGQVFELSPYVGAGSTLFVAEGVGFERNDARTRPVLRVRAGSHLGASLGMVYVGARAEITGGPSVAFRSAAGIAIATTQAIGAEFAAVVALRFGLWNGPRETR